MQIFRPRTGDYFFIATVLNLLKENGIELVSDPVLGIIFLSMRKRKTITTRNMKFSFRPRTGDYFFILERRGSLFNPKFVFPSPYWGLFFYLKK